MQPRDLIRRFREVFGPTPDALSAAPGRVNLIGEHVDYNDGLVLPLAIHREVVAVGRLTETPGAAIHSVNFEETRRFDWDEARPTRTWVDYPLGTLLELRRRGVAIPGIEIALYGNVPLGAGLSSSAAIEVATAALANALAGGPLTLPELALAAQRAENEFVGMRCGIMDQFASALARADHLLLLDCRSLETRHVPFALGDVKLVLLDTCVPHRLVGSAYNDRRDECARALSVIREQYHIVTALRDTTPAMLAARAGGMDATALRRATHVVDEIDRVRRTVAALEAGDLEAVGGLLNASHESLRDLYEVSCPELEIGRGEGLSVPGVLGGRVTGGGFGGCLIFLVREDSVDRFSRHVHTRYRERTGLTPEIYVTEPRGGVRVRTVVECLGESAD